MNRLSSGFIAMAVLGAVALAGCDQRPAATNQDQTHDESAMPTTPGRVDIPPIVRSNLGITFAKVKRRHVSRTVRVPGRFELQPTARRDYRMSMPGHVELLVDQYESVAAGQPLFRFRSSQWSALQCEIAETQQATALAESELHVAQAAIDEQHVRLEIARQRLAALQGAEVRRADLELQAAEIEASIKRLSAELESAKVRLTTARHEEEHTLARAAATLNVSAAFLLEPVDGPDGQSVPRYQTLDVVTVHAQTGGVVENINVTSGSFVDEAALVLCVVDPAKLRFRASLLQSEAQRLGNDADAFLAPGLSSDVDASDYITATVALGLEASPSQRTVEAIALPTEHRPWMRPGVSAFLEVVIEGGDRAELAIPRSALMKDGLHYVFFRRDPREPNVAVRTEADLGPDDGRWVAIRSGLRLGDEVVVGGAYELMLATAQSGGAMKGGHFHPDGTWHAEDH